MRRQGSTVFSNDVEYECKKHNNQEDQRWRGGLCSRSGLGNVLDINPESVVTVYYSCCPLQRSRQKKSCRNSLLKDFFSRMFFNTTYWRLTGQKMWLSIWNDLKVKWSHISVLNSSPFLFLFTDFLFADYFYQIHWPLKGQYCVCNKSCMIIVPFYHKVWICSWGGCILLKELIVSSGHMERQKLLEFFCKTTTGGRVKTWPI